jgi:hypothetical protein
MPAEHEFMSYWSAVRGLRESTLSMVIRLGGALNIDPPSWSA